MAEPAPSAVASIDSESGRTAAEMLRHARFLTASFSATPDYVYAFDRERRFTYANPTMLALFGLTAEQMLGRTFEQLNYPQELADLLNSHIDRIFAEGVTVEDEAFFHSTTGHAAYFAYLWGPVWDEDGSIETVVGVSRDTSRRHAYEETLRTSEARLRAATDLVGLAIYSWDPVTGALDWDERLRAMWGLPAGAPVDMMVYEAGIHPDDLDRLRAAIAASVDPAGNGSYNIEYRVIGRDDGVSRHISTAGRTEFEQGRAVNFIGAAIEVSSQRAMEAAVRASETQFRGFAANSSNLIWIADPLEDKIIYRSAAYERIWGVPCPEGPTDLAAWMQDVHPEDRAQVEHALDSVKAGEVAEFEYRIIRPGDAATRWLRDTSFPIPDENGAVTRIGGITEDLTQTDMSQVYIVSASPGEARKLGNLVRGLGHRARTFDSVSSFLDVAPVLASGCVLVDLRRRREGGLSMSRELRARSIPLPVIALESSVTGAAAVVATMRSGAVDCIIDDHDASFGQRLAQAIADCHGTVRLARRDESAGARIAMLTSREREVLAGLVDGGTNKVIAQKLGISPRTIELHRSQVMNRLNAGSLTELLQIALSAGITPSLGGVRNTREPT